MPRDLYSSVEFFRFFAHFYSNAASLQEQSWRDPYPCAGFRCSKPDAFGAVPHRHSRGADTDTTTLAQRSARPSLPNIGLGGAEDSGRADTRTRNVRAKGPARTATIRRCRANEAPDPPFPTERWWPERAEFQGGPEGLRPVARGVKGLMKGEAGCSGHGAVTLHMAPRCCTSSQRA